MLVWEQIMINRTLASKFNSALSGLPHFRLRRSLSSFRFPRDRVLELGLGACVTCLSPIDSDRVVLDNIRGQLDTFRG